MAVRRSKDTKSADRNRATRKRQPEGPEADCWRGPDPSNPGREWHKVSTQKRLIPRESAFPTGIYLSILCDAVDNESAEQLRCTVTRQRDGRPYSTGARANPDPRR